MKGAGNLAVVAVRRDILLMPDIFVTDGNAANLITKSYPGSLFSEVVPVISEILGMEYGNEEDGSKRRIMAECLVPDRIPPEYIESIYVNSHTTADRVLSSLGTSRLPVIPEKRMFFEPVRKINLTHNLSLVDGDLFFSGLQTITVSVNVVGVMGKGLASRAKYQFPDVYVYYQDLCRNRKLRMGVPALYTRETSFELQLMDEPSTMKQPKENTWFLLFPTKKHWRNRGDIKAIEKGLQWLIERYRELKIKSLAVPALGCGLGGLDWKDVGPLLCKYLSKMDIPVWIYLPAEKRIPNQFLTRDFLLPKESDIHLKAKERATQLPDY